MTNALSPSDWEEYLSNGGRRCPYCNSNSMTHGEGRTDSTLADMYWDVSCNSCKRDWTEHYTLTAVVTDEGTFTVGS